VFAEPNLRGGGEFGEKWHRAGTFEKKQNVFDDFIAAAEWLVMNHYTEPGKIGIEGVSNGGLLVGAAVTQRPDLFGAVVCGYPLLDMLRYQKFKVEVTGLQSTARRTMPGSSLICGCYSPYQNVHKGTKYPAVIVYVGRLRYARRSAARAQDDGADAGVYGWR
jgi:prolyl oligopeptidase